MRHVHRGAVGLGPSSQPPIEHSLQPLLDGGHGRLDRRLGVLDVGARAAHGSEAPFVGATITYAVLKAMREGYMYDLNRRYYRLRPPR